MNTGEVTGGVVKGAVRAYTPARVLKVVFTIAISDSEKAVSYWNCEAVGKPELLDLLEREAQPGRGIKVKYELSGRPYVKDRFTRGELRFLRVIDAEVAPPRARHANEETEPVPETADQC